MHFGTIPFHPLRICFDNPIAKILSEPFGCVTIIYQNMQRVRSMGRVNEINSAEF